MHAGAWRTVCQVSGAQASAVGGLGASHCLLDSGVDITLDASLVMLSFLLRRGYIALEREATAGILDLA